ncbi:ATP-binding protein [Streptomonospora nanhaiensis]|uniref:Anti-sigma regulatory factor (Ser/Thr protein kinase) n=1 Tax=Streptomonospora nanhaiensis TaxID=1323731 RepID=A0A853BRX2_9ACTN|nr:ATP-binding protein [Streptomonospora nanhaiensis]MBX9390334.1 ATP-binding protein [Streptomonospora nanhaiensis]NYI98138.1 anti-sigma regulatory factor (Ser/Thr protein kinase) [Streptomonospora nanhaiensis]
MSDSQRLREYGAAGPVVPDSAADPADPVETAALEASEYTEAATDHTVWSCVGNLTAVRSIRARVREFLERSAPPQSVLDDAELASSELATNALLHSRSGQTGGVMTLFIRSSRDRVRVAVADQGEKHTTAAPTDPARPDNDDYGRGKLIIESCTTRSGEYWTETTHVAWFEIDVNDPDRGAAAE